MHQYKKGVEYGLKAVRKLENQNRPQPLSYAYHNLAYNYLKLGQFPEARKNFDKALSYAVKSNEKPVELMGTLNIAYIYLLKEILIKRSLLRIKVWISRNNLVQKRECPTPIGESEKYI
jgi:tetratricopeptide (TPR) repeat protein